MSIRFIIGTTILALIASTASAGELRYTPVNPLFGGNPFNASHLMARASAQNDQERPSSTTNGTANLASTIRNSILNRTAYSIADAVFKQTTDATKYGVEQNAFSDGTTRIDYVQDGNGGLTIIITDLATGERTTIGGFANQHLSQLLILL